MNLSQEPLTRLTVVALIPWLLSWWMMRGFRWSATAWVNRSIEIQSALLSIIFAAQFSGSMGLYRLTEAWLAPLVYVLATRFFAMRDEFKPAEPANNQRYSDFNSCDLIIAALTIFLVLLEFGRMAVPSLVGAVKVVSDAPIYHLYFAAKWWLAGSIDYIPIPFGENAAPYFPANGDLWFMTLVGWTGDLTLAKMGQVPFWFLAGYWIYCLCQILGAGRVSSLLASAHWMTLAPLAIFTFEANVDTIFATWFIGSVLFYVEYDLKRNNHQKNDTKKTGELHSALFYHSLLAAGLAWGTKAPGIVFIPPWLVVVSIREWSLSDILKVYQKLIDIFKMWGVAILPVAFWWVRNAIVTGNPLYPLPVEIAGITLFDGWYGPGVMRLSPYFIPFGEWRAFLDQIVVVADPRVLPLMAIAIATWGFKARREKTLQNKWILWLTLFGLATVAIYWCFIPYRTQQRFFLHGLALFAPVLAVAIDRFFVIKLLSIVALAMHVTSPQGWPFVLPGKEPFWDLSPLIPNRMPGLVPVFEISARAITGDLKSISLILFAFGMTLAIGLFLQNRRIPISIVFSLAGLAGFGMMIYAEHSSFRKLGRGENYPVFPDYERAWFAFDAITRKQPRNVAYTGTNLAIYLMGPRFQNRVEYINVDEHTDWQPHDYHRAQPPEKSRWPDPRPTWERLSPVYEAWLANLKARKIDLVVVARANPNEGRLNPYDSLGFPIERTWMAEHPDQFAPVYGVRENDPEMRIYELKK